MTDNQGKKESKSIENRSEMWKKNWKNRKKLSNPSTQPHSEESVEEVVTPPKATTPSKAAPSSTPTTELREEQQHSSNFVKPYPAQISQHQFEQPDPLYSVVSLPQHPDHSNQTLSEASEQRAASVSSDSRMFPTNSVRIEPYDQHFQNPWFSSNSSNPQYYNNIQMTRHYENPPHFQYAQYQNSYNSAQNPGNHSYDQNFHTTHMPNNGEHFGQEKNAVTSASRYSTEMEYTNL